jgi:hypothetical protein
MPSSVYISFVFNVNKSVLNGTQVCQLHSKTQLHESCVPATSACSSRGIFAEATNSTNQTKRQVVCAINQSTF